MKRYNSEKVEQDGYEARMRGKPQSTNPYKFTSRKNMGVQKQAWWDAGWSAADKAQTEQQKGE